MSDTIAVLSDLDKIRQRPGMYIGDNDRLGLNTITREIIDNAVDEYVNYPDKTKPIVVTLAKDNVVSVRDHGRGISPYQSKKVKGAIEERLAFTLIGSGGKFRENRAKNGNQFSGGLNGTGSVGTNAMSEFFDVVIYKDGYRFEDHYEDGIPKTKLIKGNLPKTKLKEQETGTCITFKPSKKYMRVVKIDTTYLNRYLQLVAYLNPGLTIHFINERDDEDMVTYYSENGLLDYMSALAVDDDNKSINYLVEPFMVSGTAEETVMGQVNHMQVTIAVAFVKGDSFAAEAFTNGVENSSGGTHLQGFYQGLVNLLRHYYDEFQSDFNTKYRTQLELIRKVNNLSSISEVFKLVKSRNISRKTYVIIDFKHDDPILKPQTKDELASPEAKSAVADIFYNKALLYLDKHVPAIHELIGYLIKDLYEKAKNENTNLKLNTTEIKQAISTKLAAAKSKDPKRKEIFIVEGDSAAGTAKTNRDSNFQAILALRGKILNAKKALLSKLMANAEIATFIATIGTGIGSKYDDKKRQYDKIIIATDQDVDGLHIRVLLITLIMQYMPDLIRNGHVYYLDTPLYVNVMKGKAEDVYTYSENEQLTFVAKNKTRIEETQRNKGLGELTKEQVITTMLTPETRRLTQLTINDEDAVADLIEQLMGKDVQSRKRLFTDTERLSIEDTQLVVTKKNKNIHQADIYPLIKSNFYDYGMNVIEERALPDVRDGLKPVHRAIIYEMLNSKITSKSKPTKLAKITGAVIGNWHPHGDRSVEEAASGLAVPWKNTLPLISIKGNQGSVFGDSAAAGRYIEARLQPAGDAYGYKLKKGIVPYVPNFDNTGEMPTILPAQLPAILINGINDAIAVGVASCLPPHNAKEVLSMVIQYLKKPKTKTAELLTIMPGPDFPTGATIINQDDLEDIYKTGYGKLNVRSTLEYDKKEHALHVKEIPFIFSGSMNNLVTDLVMATTERIDPKTRKKIPPKVPGVNSVMDYSGKDGIDISIELQKGVDPKQMLQTLYAKTRLETTVKFNFQALNNKRLHSYSLRQYLTEYTDFQHEIVTNEHVLEKEELSRKLEIITGRLIALTLIDEIIDVVKHSHGRSSIKDVLMNGTILPGTKKSYHKTVSGFRFTEIQAETISGMPLYQLNQLDGDILQKDGREIQKRLEIVEKIINDEKYRHKLIIKRLQKEYDALPDMPRKTRIISDTASKVSELETPTVELYTAMDKYGYVKIEGKPFDGAITTDNKSRIGFFDSSGNCWNLFLDRAKETKDRGTLISQLIDTTDNIVGFTTNISDIDGKQGLFIYTDGRMKRCDLSRFMTKTRATKVNTRIKDQTLKLFTEIPSDVNIVTIDNIDYVLDTIPLQTPSGNGKMFISPKDEPHIVEFKKGTVKASSTKVAKNDVFDAVVVFDDSDTCTFDWTTLDVSSKEGLYVTTYQQLIKDTLLFVHSDGTAKRVDGKQFAVKSKRQSIQANKTGMVPIYIAKANEKTLVGTYEGGKQKRIDATKIPMQGKVGGGARVFYSTKYQFQTVESGQGSDLPIVSFATQPK